MKTVIEMAREAGLFTHKEVQPEIRAFAELVRADEREVMLHLAISHGAPWHFREAIYARGSKKTKENQS